MTLVTVPGRRFYLEASSNWSQLVFTSPDLWSYPYALCALQAKIFWDSEMDGTILGVNFTPEVAAEFLQWRIVYHSLDGMDIQPLLEQNADIWVVQCDFKDLEQRIRELLDSCDRYQDHLKLHILLDVAWQITQTVKGFIPVVEELFWVELARLWIYRYKAAPVSLNYLDLGMDEQQLALKLDRMVNA